MSAAMAQIASAPIKAGAELGAESATRIPALAAIARPMNGWRGHALKSFTVPGGMIRYVAALIVAKGFDSPSQAYMLALQCRFLFRKKAGGTSCARARRTALKTNVPPVSG